jgi:hypothetical protein
MPCAMGGARLLSECDGLVAELLDATTHCLECGDGMTLNPVDKITRSSIAASLGSLFK